MKKKPQILQLSSKVLYTALMLFLLNLGAIQQMEAQITCPPPATVECGDPIDPTALGFAIPDDPTLAVTFVDITTPGCPNTAVITRVWSTVSFPPFICTQEITVEDTTPPTITCAPAQTVECGDPIVFGTPTAMDSCDPAPPTITFTDASVPGCGNTEVITRTWTATDACGNMAICSATIDVVDTTPPTITCAAQTTPVECPGMPVWVDPMVMDDCDMAPVVTFLDEITPTCGNTFSVTRTWTATDACGNAATCSQIITVEDNNPPTITCPADVTVECDQPTDPGATGNATASGDNCAADDELTVTFIDVSTQTPTGCGNDTYTITRTWTASDPCGNTAQCVQTINVEDTTPPTIICPANATIECDESTIPGTSGTGTATGAAPTNSLTWSDATSGFIGDVVATPAGIPAGATVTDVNISIDMDHSFVNDLNLTLTSPDGTAVNFLDGSGGFRDNVSVTFDDEGAPYIIVAASGDVGTPDDCSNDYLIASAITGTLQPEQNSFTTFDGGTAGGDWTLQVTDDAGGDGGCLVNFSIEVSWMLVAGGTTGSAVAVDDCAPEDEIDVTFSDVTTQTADGCGQYEYVITRTWTATDPCGNAASCVQIINVEDTTAPEIACPADVSLSCTDSTDPAATGMATSAGDNCSDVSEIVISSSDISTQTATGCGQYTYTINRTWAATDACGNETTCVQIIDVADTEAPVITCPPSQTLTCFQTLPAPFTNAADFVAGGGTISDNCTANLSEFSVFTQNDDNGGDNCPGNARTVVRTYFVADACGNTTTCTQTFTYLESTQGPVITSVLPTCFKYCASLANPMEADITYDTDCSFGATVDITGPTQIGPDNCPGSIYRYTYTVTDDCGRTSAPVTRDFVIGNDGPTIECAPFNLLLECGDPNNSDYIAAHVASVTANSSCELGVNITYFPTNFNNITCNTSTVVTFRATDDCGRQATCTTTINISDNTAPEITSTYVDGVCNEAVCGSNVNFWFNEWKAKVLEGLSATDACDSNVSFTTTGSPNVPAQDCPDGTAETVVTWIANDNCGNTSGISYSFYVVPADAPTSGPAIMGMVATEQTETVENVSVTLEGNGLSISDVTAADGMYGFDNLLEGQNYSVTPLLDENPLNGVSSYDLVLITKHILELEALDSPYKIIAADVNNSGSVTTMDMVELRKLILHIDENFANNTSWRFVEAAYVFPTPTNPFATVFPEEVNINGLSADEEHDFVGVKIGDVNGSAVTNALGDAEDRTSVDELLFNVKDQKLVAGETYKVAFETTDFEAIHGYQFTMNFDQDALDFEAVSAGNLTGMTEANFGLSLLEEGVITTSWTNQTAQSVVRESAVFYLSFTAKKDGLLSKVLTLNSSYTKAEAYNGNLELMDVALRFDGVDELAASTVELYQNLPNPFRQETVIGFDLPESGKATLTIYDAAGRSLKQVEGAYEKGYNSISISKDGLSSGVLHYQLVTPFGTATKKMVLQ